MTSTIPRLPACDISGCDVDRTAAPGQRVFHGDPDPVFNDAPSAAQLRRGDLLHDGCAVYTWSGRAWRLVIDTNTSLSARGGPVLIKRGPE